MPNATLPVLVEVTETESGFETALASETMVKRSDVSVDVLKENLGTEVTSLLEVLESLSESREWGLEEVEIGVSISAEGGVSFIGTASMRAGSALRLRFRKR
ncbi:MAG: hypothetical protein KTR21_09890 [Rhodobacteraceae bacterium]|nr:hypothetical protein [Paracoccaceae bacterium]